MNPKNIECRLVPVHDEKFCESKDVTCVYYT